MVRTISVIGLTIVSLMCGLNGFKGLMGFYVPMVMPSIFLWFYHWYTYKGRIPLYLNKLVVLSLYALAVCGYGYLINHEILADIYSFYSYDSQSWVALDIGNLIKQISMFLSLFGYPADGFIANSAKLFSIEGILGCFGLINAGLIIISSVWSFHRVKRLDGLYQVIPVLLTMIILFQGMIFAFTSGPSVPNGSYWLVAVPFALLNLQLYFDQCQFKKTMVKPILICLFWLSFGMISIATISNFFDHGMRINPNLKPVCDFLQSNGYTKGYASFWNGNVLTEWSSGAIEVWVSNDLTTLQPYAWLQHKSHMNPPKDEFFVLLSQNEIERFELQPLVKSANRVYPYSKDTEAYGYTILIFDDFEQYHELVNS